MKKYIKMTFILLMICILLSGIPRTQLPKGTVLLDDD